MYQRSGLASIFQVDGNRNGAVSRFGEQAFKAPQINKFALYPIAKLVLQGKQVLIEQLFYELSKL